MAAHTAFASEFLENAVQSTPLQLQGVSSKMDAALSSLRHLVNMQENRRAVSSFHEFRLQGQKQSSKATLRDLPLPPMTLVAEKLKEMKCTRLSCLDYCFITPFLFIDCWETCCNHSSLTFSRSWAASRDARRDLFLH